MDRLLGLYDRRGQLQRVALARGDDEYQQYIDAGFVEISESEYNRGTAIAEPVKTRDLALLATAGALLNTIQSQEAQGARLPANYQPPREMLKTVQTNADAELRTITQDYLDGRISIDQWQRRMTDTINQSNLAGRALSVNGTDNLTRADLRAVERANETQAQYLAAFRRELEAGNLSNAQALARSSLYSTSSTPIFENGYTEAIGLPPLPATPGVGSACRSNCLCSWRIEPLEGNGNWDCYWVLSKAEHCQNCIARSFSFNPLQIRNGIIQPYNPTGLFI